MRRWLREVRCREGSRLPDYPGRIVRRHAAGELRVSRHSRSWPRASDLPSQRGLRLGDANAMRRGGDVSADADGLSTRFGGDRLLSATAHRRRVYRLPPTMSYSRRHVPLLHHATPNTNAV